MMSKIMDGLKKLASSQSPELEMNLVAYGLGVLAMIGWITAWVCSGPRNGDLVGAFGVFAAAVTGGLFKRGSNAPKKDGEA